MSNTRSVSSQEVMLHQPRWTRWAGEAMHFRLAHGRGELVLVLHGDWVQYIPAKTLANGALYIIDARPGQG